jgi:hypothetical protein
MKQHGRSRFTPFASLALALATAFACSSQSDGDDDTGGSGASSGTAARGGTATGGSSGKGGTSGKGGSGGGSSASGGSSATGSGGTTPLGSGGSGATGGSGGSGAYPSAACEGLSFDGEGGGGGDQSCVGVGSEAETVPADLYILMDRSVSMAQMLPDGSGTRWDAVRDAIEAFVDAASDDDINVGIGFYGRTGGDDDQLDCDTDWYATPRVAMGPIDEVGSDLVSAIDDVNPGGYTPTAPALTGALRYAAEWSEEHTGRAMFVVLVSDGYPTQCSTLDISAIADIAEAAHRMEPYVRTYVVGVAADANLNSIALGGGTNEAFLVDEGNITEDFVDALRNVSTKQLACEYQIPPPPSGSQNVNFNEVQVVYTTGNGASSEEIPRVGRLEDCARAQNGGWYYDDPADPKQIRVCPCTCSRFQAGSVDIRLGCKPRVGLR